MKLIKRDEFGAWFGKYERELSWLIGYLVLINVTIVKGHDALWQRMVIAVSPATVIMIVLALVLDYYRERKGRKEEDNKKQEQEGLKKTL